MNLMFRFYLLVLKLKYTKFLKFNLIFSIQKSYSISIALEGNILMVPNSTVYIEMNAMKFVMENIYYTTSTKMKTERLLYIYQKEIQIKWMIYIKISALNSVTSVSLKLF